MKVGRTFIVHLDKKYERQGALDVDALFVKDDSSEQVTAKRAEIEADMAAAREWHYRLFPLCRDLLGLSTNPIPIKGAMKILGRDTGELRLPMTPLSAGEEQKLVATLRTYGIL